MPGTKKIFETVKIIIKYVFAKSENVEVMLFFIANLQNRWKLSIQFSKKQLFFLYNPFYVFVMFSLICEQIFVFKFIYFAKNVSMMFDV